MDKTNARINLWLPSNLKTALLAMAKKEDRSLNYTISKVLSDYVAALKLSKNVKNTSWGNKAAELPKGAIAFDLDSGEVSVGEKEFGRIDYSKKKSKPKNNAAPKKKEHSMKVKITPHAYKGKEESKFIQDEISQFAAPKKKEKTDKKFNLSEELNKV